MGTRGGSGQRRARAGLVADWPQYLITNVPAELRGLLSEEASELTVSVSDVVRTILCRRYRMKCPPESYRYDAGRDTGAANMLLRMQPKLAVVLERQSKRTGVTKRQIILDAIEAHYTEGSA